MTNSFIINALLTYTKSEWNLYKASLSKDNFPPPLILDNNSQLIISVDGLDLSNKDFSGFNLSNVHFNRSNLSGSKFTDCTFNDGLLRACNIECTDFSNSDFTKAKVSNCKCNNQTKFICIVANSCQDADPFRTVFTLNFNGSNLKNADFNGSDLRNSSFLDANVEGTIFRRSDLNNTSWQNTIIDEHTDFQLANFDHHAVTRDKSDLVRFSPHSRNWLFNWGSIRFRGCTR